MRPCAGASWEPSGQLFSGIPALPQPGTPWGPVWGLRHGVQDVLGAPRHPVSRQPQPRPAALPSLGFPRPVSWRVTYFVPTPRASEERD